MLQASDWLSQAMFPRSALSDGVLDSGTRSVLRTDNDSNGKSRQPSETSGQQATNLALDLVSVQLRELNVKVIDIVPHIDLLSGDSSQKICWVVQVTVCIDVPGKPLLDAVEVALR